MSYRIGALDIAEAISQRIGSFVGFEGIEFLAVDGNDIHCWYMNAGGEGPTYPVKLSRTPDGWSMDLTQYPPGTEQEIEVP